jgi:hypothetical protein
MKKILFTIFSFQCMLGISQTWNKISGIMDSTQIKSVAEINNQVVVAGQNWILNNQADYAFSSDGNTWTKIPTYQFGGWAPTGLPQNNLIVNPNGFTNTRKLAGNSTWQAFNTLPYNYAEFANGTIIGGSAGYPDTLYNISSSGVKGTKIGNQLFKLSFKYCNGTNNRLFIFSYGSGLAYIDYSNLSAINYPATLDGLAMTKASWEARSVVDMVRTSNGDLFAADQLYGIMKSTDNGQNWTTILSGVSGRSITKNGTNELFVVLGNSDIRKSSNGGTTFININGNLPSSGFKADIFVNASNEVFAFLNSNGSTNPANSGIFKLSSAIGIEENALRRAVKIFPNPVVNVLNISSEQLIRTVEVKDALGNVISNFESNERTVAINTSNYSTGFYFIEVRLENGTTSLKFIKD